MPPPMIAASATTSAMVRPRERLAPHRRCPVRCLNSRGAAAPRGNRRAVRRCRGRARVRSGLARRRDVCVHGLGGHVLLRRAGAASLRGLGEHLLGRRGVGPGGRILPQKRADDGRERAGVLERIGLLLHDGLHGGERRGAAERRHALHRGVEGRAERPQVGRGAGVVTADPFGRQVVDGPDDLAGAGDGRVAVYLRDAEVGEQHPAVPAEQHVAGLDVAVQDAGGVRGAQGAQHPQADAGGLARLDALLLLDRVGQRAALDQLHDDPRPAVVLQHVVHGDDGRVVDPRGGPRLRARACQQGGLFAVGDVERGGQFLDGDGPVQHLVVCAPHPAHATAPDGVAESVAARDERALHLIHVAPQWS
ncbi:hypothetical protein STENM223S_00951 [Streptomyces tendae]